MPHTQQLLPSHPRRSQLDLSAVQQCIEACYDCASACTMCADACLGEQQLQMLVRCIRLDLDCADICLATGTVISRQTEADWGLIRAQLHACATACQVCAAECEQHAQHGMAHCRACAEACRRCAEACERLLQAVPAGNGAHATG